MYNLEGQPKTQPILKKAATLGLSCAVAMALVVFNSTTQLAAPQVTVMPGSVVQGEQLLDGKGCLHCHSLNGQGGNRAPDFARPSARARTPEVFASAMWNHSPRMWAEFQAQGRAIPTLESAEVADIFAYLYATLYFSPQGSATRGRNVFQEKRCASCHSGVLDTRSRKSTGEGWRELKDPIAWAEGMWNHAGEMNSATTNRGISWPKLSEQDVVDLLMFLSQLPDATAQIPSFHLGEPQVGRNVFENSCEGCHSFGGSSDKSKVNLLTRPRPLSITGYIAAMWNHAPEMRRRGGSTPKLNAGEMRDLIAFLFSQRYFLDRGNPSKGRRIFEGKGCARCHEERRKETGASDLTQSSEVFSPITLTSSVWRHGPSMMAKMKDENIPWPEFTGSEMTDLITYLNSKLVLRVAHRPGPAVY